MKTVKNKQGRKGGLQLSQRRGPKPRLFSLKSVRFSLWSMFVFSFVGGGISALGAIFVIQIYDRVLPSHSIPTLVILAILFAFFYICHGVLMAITGRVAERTGLTLLEKYEPLFLRLTQTKRRSGLPKRDALVPLYDFRDVVSAIRGRILTSVFDLSWVPILIIVLGFISPLMAAFAGCILLLNLGVAYFDKTQESEGDGRHHALWQASLSREHALFAPPTRLARLVAAGYQRERSENLTARDYERGLKGFSIALREIGHSGMLVVGALLVLTDAMSIGAMMASGMLMMRILAPVQTILRDKASLSKAYQAWKRLRTYDLGSDDRGSHDGVSTHNSGIETPRSAAHSTIDDRLQVSQLTLSPPKSEGNRGNVSFSLAPGQCLIVAGAAGTGKTLLLKRLCGIVGSKPGAVLIGDEALATIDDERLSRIIGYMPQESIFPPGTLAEIITKFAPDPSRANLIAMAKRIGIHDAIMALEQGYETLLAPGEVPLPSTLLRQIAFVRAMIDEPVLLLLDDPFRGLSVESARKMVDVINASKSSGTSIIMAMPEFGATEPAATELADFIMVLGLGKVLALGSTSEVLAQPATRLLQRGANGGANLALRTGSSPNASPRASL